MFTNRRYRADGDPRPQALGPAWPLSAKREYSQVNRSAKLCKFLP
jgi:hypothetical protein